MPRDSYPPGPPLPPEFFAPRKPLPQASLVDRINRAIVYYGGPHVNKTLQNLTEAFRFTDAGDAEELVNQSSALTDAFKRRDFWGTANQIGPYTAASIAAFTPILSSKMVGLPGKLPAKLPMDEASRMARAEVAGRNIDAYHGTTHDLKEFQPAGAYTGQKYTVESHHGGGPYATSSPHDASVNYAGEGPDLTNRIERRAEQLEWELDEMGPEKFEWAYGTADPRQAAREELSGVIGGQIIPLKLRMKNPAVVDYASEGGRKSTFWEFVEKYDEELDEFDEPEGPAMKIIEAARDELRSSGLSQKDVDVVVGQLYERAWDNGGLSSLDLEAVMRSEPASYAMEWDEIYTPGQMLQNIYKAMGYDGVMMHGAERIFPGMNMRPDTTHYLVFDPKDIRSRFAKFDPARDNSADILAGISAAPIAAAPGWSWTESEQPADDGWSWKEQ